MVHNLVRPTFPNVFVYGNFGPDMSRRVERVRRLAVTLPGTRIEGLCLCPGPSTTEVSTKELERSLYVLGIIGN